MKFIHTSDWHIGRQFHNVSLLEDQKHVLDQIVAYIGTTEADALIISGDIYDRSVPPASAVAVLDEVFHRISKEYNIPIIIISGNHDSAQRLSFAARQLKEVGLHILGDIREVENAIKVKGKSGVEVNFYGIPYNDPEEVRNCFDEKLTGYNAAHTFLVDKIKNVMDTNERNVLLSHCFIGGAIESDSERPLSIGGADNVSYEPLLDFDYVALGHLHGPQFRGKQTIRYSGSIMKYSFSEEKHNKAVTLVEIPENGGPVLKQLPLKSLRNLRVIEGEMEQILEMGKTDPNSDDYIMVRLVDTHAILDAMGKLRDVYPNVLHLEKTGIMAVGEKRDMNREMLKRKPLDMFHDFYEQVSGQKISEDQSKALEDILSKLDAGELK